MLLINPDDFYPAADPIRGKVDPPAVAAQFNGLFQHLLAVSLEFYFLFISCGSEILIIFDRSFIRHAKNPFSGLHGEP